MKYCGITRVILNYITRDFLYKICVKCQKHTMLNLQIISLKQKFKCELYYISVIFYFQYLNIIREERERKLC